MGKTHRTSNDGVCDNCCFSSSLFRKTHRVSLSPTPTTTVEIPISSVINPPVPSSAYPPQGNGTVKSTGKSKPPAEIGGGGGGGGIKKKDDGDGDDEGFSGYIDRAKAKIRGSSTFKIGDKKKEQGIMMGSSSSSKTKRADSLNFRFTNYINRTKLKINQAPSTRN